MSTRCTIRNARDEVTGQGFHLYEDLAENGKCVMLELEGFTFETSVSFASSGDFETRILLRIPKRWARKLGLFEEPKTNSAFEEEKKLRACEAAHRLADIGGTMPNLPPIPRRRSSNRGKKP